MPNVANKCCEATKSNKGKWTFCAEVVDQPLGCIVDHFWSGFEVGQRITYGGVGYMEILGLEVLPSDVIAALSHPETSPVLAYLYGRHGALCVPMHWLEPVTENEYDSQEEAA